MRKVIATFLVRTLSRKVSKHMHMTRDSQSGGRPISETTKRSLEQRLVAHAKKHYSGKYQRLEMRFKGPFCYIDAYKEPSVPSGTKMPTGETREQFIERVRSTPIHLCRLRHFSEDRWSVAFYRYSNEKYEPCLFPSGDWFGPPEIAFDVGAVYLNE